MSIDNPQTPNQLAQQVSQQENEMVQQMAEQLADASDESEGGGFVAPEKSLDMVRNILFGEQVRTVERKQISLERFIRASVGALKEEMQLEMDALRSDLAALSGQLADETKNRKAAVATAQERFSNLEQSIDRLGNQTRADHHEIRQRMIQEAQQLSRQMQDWRSDMLSQLEQASNELRYAKTDRKGMAALLQNMARQLAEDDPQEQALLQAQAQSRLAQAVDTVSENEHTAEAQGQV